MKLIFKDPRLKRQIIHLLVPFLLQELVIVLTTLTSNLILSAWGCHPEVMTGVTNAFQVFFLYNTIAGSVGFVGNLFMSQHYGRGAIEDVKKDYYLLLKIVMAMGVIFFVLSLAIPEQLFFFVKDTESKRYAAEYLRYFSPVFILFSPSLINYVLMKNARLEKFCTLSSLITFATVLILESSLMFGLNVEDLALELTASSMVVARAIELAFLFIIINKKCVVKFKFKEFIKSDYERLKTMTYYGTPIVISKLSWGMGFIMVTVIANKFVDIDGAKGLFDAHSIMLTYQNIVSCLSNAVSGVVAVIIGRELGANRMQKAKDHGDEIMRLLFLMGLIEIALLMLFLPIAIAITPNMTKEARSFLWKVFLIQCIAYIPRSYNASTCNGFFTVGGDTFYVMLVDGITAWVTIVPLGYIGLHFNWNPLLIYALIELEEVFKCPFNIWRYTTKKWVFNITHKKGIVFNE